MKCKLPLLALLCSAPLGRAADFHTPVSITSPNSVAYYPIVQLHQGPGVGYSGTPPHAGNAGQTWVTDAPGGYPADYYNFRAAPLLLIDLGADRYLTEISTWGYTTSNDNGVKTFALRFATAAQGTAGFGAGQGPFNCAKSDTARDSHPLTPVTARYVEFTCTDNYYTGTGAAGGDRVGLGEIAFEYVPAPITVRIEATPGIVDFGNHATEPGTVARTVTVRNTGTSAALNLSAVAVDGADAARFSVVSFPASVAAGTEGTMTLNFNSGGVDGCWFAWLRIHSNDPANPVTTLGLLASVNCTPAAPEQPLFSQAAGTFGANFPLTLTSPTPGAAIIFTTDGTVPSLSNGQPYTGPMQMTRTTMVRAACVLAGQVSGIESAGFIKLSPALLAKTSPLPILVVENFGAGTIPDKGWTTGHQTGAGLRQKPRQPAMLSFHDRAATGRATLLGASSVAARAGIRVRGAFSSTWFPKPYSVETWKEDNSDKSLPLLGMPQESDWVLYHPHPSYDTTMIFNTYIWELSRRTGRYAPQFRYVEVYVNEDGSDLDVSDRRGLYALVEQVKRDADRVNFEPLSADGSTGGWMHSFNRMDPEPEAGFPAANGATVPQLFRTAGPNRLLQTVANNPTQSGDDIPRQYNCFINFEDPNGYDITATQRAAITGWFTQFENALYDNAVWRDPVNGYRRYLDTRDFIDYFQLLNLARQGDGLLLSMYPWVSSGERKLRMGPMWDFNNGPYHHSGSPTATLYYRQSELWYPRLFADPDFLNEYIDRWYELRRGPYANASLQAIADEQAALITTEMANAQGVSTAGWNSGLTAMKNFLTQRAEWIDTQYVKPPNFSPAPGVQPAAFTLTLTNPAAEAGTIYYTTNGSDPRTSGTAYTGPFLVSTSAVIKARTLTSTTSRWSGLNEGYFFTGTPASAANLVVSELHYNPPGSADAGEFLEVMNIAAQSIDLTGAGFDSGIQFAFPSGTTLAPGERAIVAANAADFSGPRVLGSYGPGSALDNGGEHLRLRAWNGAVIEEFIWDDVAPWPELPDGEGSSLTLIKPQTNPDPSLSANWRASIVPGGTPGTTDATTFTGNPAADDNGDGINNLVAYALGPQLPTVQQQNGSITWDIPFNPAAEDVSLIPEWSADLVNWQPAATLFPGDVRTENLRRLDTFGPVAARRVCLRVTVSLP